MFRDGVALKEDVSIGLACAFCQESVPVGQEHQCKELNQQKQDEEK